MKQVERYISWNRDNQTHWCSQNEAEEAMPSPK